MKLSYALKSIRTPPLSINVITGFNIMARPRLSVQLLQRRRLLPQSLNIRKFSSSMGLQEVKPFLLADIGEGLSIRSRICFYKIVCCF